MKRKKLLSIMFLVVLSVFVNCGEDKINPIADFSANPTTGIGTTTVQFTDESDPGSSPITIWYWDFGVGAGSSMQNPDHPYDPGTYTVTLTVTTADGTDSEMKSNFIAIDQSPHIALSPTTMSFSGQCNGWMPGSQTFTITNSGDGTLNWSVSDDVTWLDETPTGGNSDSATITVSVNTTDLSEGPHYATITVSSSDADNNPQTIDVTYHMYQYPPPHIVLSPTTMSFSAQHNGLLPDSQTFTITNSGDGTLNWSVSDDATWLVESPTDGNSNSATITVSVNTTDLSEEPHYAIITVSSIYADNSPQTIGVTYTITPPLTTAYLIINNFRQVSDDEIIADMTTNTGWTSLTVIEYDTDDMDGSMNPPGAECYDCLKLWQDQWGIQHNWIFIDHPIEDGLPISNSCDSVNIDVLGLLQGEPSSANGFFFGTDHQMDPAPPGLGWQNCENIGTTCAWDDENIDDYYLHPEEIGTRIYLWFIEPYSWADGWACQVTYTFDGWLVPVGLPPHSETIPVISAKKNPQYLPENQETKLKKANQ